MWFFSIYKLFFYNINNIKIIIQTPLIYIYLNLKFLKKIGSYIYLSNLNIINNLLKITLETNIINIKYIGKIFRIKKINKLLMLILNYTGYNYLIWNNIKLKRPKKKKRLIFTILTNQNLIKMFYYNLIRLRILNTYTKRGIYNNLLIYYNRKKQMITKR